MNALTPPAPEEASVSLPRKENCVVRYALDCHAQSLPNQIYAVFDDGTRWTFSETAHIVRELAAGLSAAGVCQGDHVLVALPNSALALKTILATNYLGAVCVPINPALKGTLLEHVATDCGARLAVIDEKLVELFSCLSAPHLTTLVSSGSICSQSTGQRRILSIEGLLEYAEVPPQTPEPIEPWHTQFIIYTSGTTGRSKGVLASYMHSFSTTSTDTWKGTRIGDRHLLHMPFFHIGGAFIASTCLCQGSSVALLKSFKTDSFWDSVRTMEVTVVFLLGAMANFLQKHPPRPGDRNHSVRMAFIVPLGQTASSFGERFGVEVYTLFNMTEISTPLLSGPNPVKPNVAGRVRAGVEVRLVDENDCEVPVGFPGQMVLRTDLPWTMNHGYLNNPVATAEAWRNGWFHTGDSFVCDSDGDFFFVDRLKDAIRRRGENISSFEIEVEVLAHPDVREAAAVAVPSEHTEDELLIVVALIPGRSLQPEDLVKHLEARVSTHMIPRYIRMVRELPRTPTEKVQKHLLRDQGLTADTWDRERSGDGRPIRQQNQ